MQKLERDGLFVSDIELTKEDWERLGKPETFQMVKVIVGEKNVAMSAPEFFGYASIPLPPEKSAIKGFGSVAYSMVAALVSFIRNKNN